MLADGFFTICRMYKYSPPVEVEEAFGTEVWLDVGILTSCQLGAVDRLYQASSYESVCVSPGVLCVRTSARKESTTRS